MVCPRLGGVLQGNRPRPSLSSILQSGRLPLAVQAAIHRPSCEKTTWFAGSGQGELPPRVRRVAVGPDEVHLPPEATASRPEGERLTMAIAASKAWRVDLRPGVGRPRRRTGRRHRPRRGAVRRSPGRGWSPRPPGPSRVARNVPSEEWSRIMPSLDARAKPIGPSREAQARPVPLPGRAWAVPEDRRAPEPARPSISSRRGARRRAETRPDRSPRSCGETRRGLADMLDQVPEPEPARAVAAGQPAAVGAEAQAVTPTMWYDRARSTGRSVAPRS